LINPQRAKNEKHERRHTMTYLSMLPASYDRDMTTPPHRWYGDEEDEEEDE
jgi:hypothetical protein